MASGKARSTPRLQESADIVAVMSKLPWEAFGARHRQGRAHQGIACDLV